MIVAKGAEVYIADVERVVARGYLYAKEDLDAARSGRLAAVLSDEPGRIALTHLYGDLALTEFGSNNVTHTLGLIHEEEHSRGWREGEALAEAWLVDHKNCIFPWPFNRDLRNQKASLPGADLIGLVGEQPEDTSFAFGQVKTTKEPRVPPQVVTNGEKSLIGQSTQLRDDHEVKKLLVDYLAHRHLGTDWSHKFRMAAVKFFDSGLMEIAIFGVLVRDRPPTQADLAIAATRLASGCDEKTRIEFCGLYLPEDSIPEGQSHKPRKSRSVE